MLFRVTFMSTLFGTLSYKKAKLWSIITAHNEHRDTKCLTIKIKMQVNNASNLILFKITILKKTAKLLKQI